MAVRDANGVPILALSNSSAEYVQGRHQSALDLSAEGDHSQLLTGHTVLVHNPKPIGAPDKPDVTVFSIGGSTLQEALTEVIGAYEFHTHLESPDFVSASDENLGKLLAEHYSCELRPLGDAAPAAPAQDNPAADAAPGGAA